ncbi:hypothetical protein BDV25DRAFT_141186 [Aspergillus avenaceus]|uniref:Uncharacterized protein n=1 Tax=Aspergillus avenaceus TaxID=36643 RepID=A0A5N6TRU0_ASPAV|nr:hypothetical protein BDV25DRAFT_141186 [Aspergillus avenaceus]
MPKKKLDKSATTKPTRKEDTEPCDTPSPPKNTTAAAQQLEGQSPTGSTQAKRRSPRLSKLSESDDSPTDPPPPAPSSPKTNVSEKPTQNELIPTASNDNILANQKGGDYDLGHEEFDPDNIPRYFGSFYLWEPYPEDDVTEKFDMIDYDAEQWMHAYGIGTLDECDKVLSDAQKQRLINGLEGHCPQVDWDLLVKRLPPQSQVKLPVTICKAIIAKDVMQSVIQDPFFYLKDNGDEVKGKHGPVYSPSRSEIHKLWQWCKQVEPTTKNSRWNSRNWRLMTIRFLNAATPTTTDDFLLGKHIKQLREEATMRFASRLVDESNPIQLLIRKLSDDERTRSLERLHEIYLDAADLSVSMWACEMDYEFGSIETLGSFTEGCRHMKKQGYTRIDEDLDHDLRVRERAPAIMILPAVTRYWAPEGKDEKALLSPAHVLLCKDSGSE